MNASKPKRSRRRKCSTGILASDITREQLEQWFHLPSSEACIKLGVSLSVLKRVCRKQGIARWPYRAAAGAAGRQPSPASSCPSQPPTPPSTFITGGSVPSSPRRCTAQQQQQQPRQDPTKQELAGEAAAALWQHLQQQPSLPQQLPSQQLPSQLLAQQPSLPIEAPCPPHPAHQRQGGFYSSDPEPMDTADNTPQVSGLDALAAVAAEAEGPSPGSGSGGWEGATSSERGGGGAGSGSSGGGQHPSFQEESSALGGSWQSSMGGLLAGPGTGLGGFVVCMDPPSPCQVVERPLSKGAVQGGGAWQVPHLFVAQAPLSYLHCSAQPLVAPAVPLGAGSIVSHRHASAFRPWAPQHAVAGPAPPRVEPGCGQLQRCGACEPSSRQAAAAAQQQQQEQPAKQPQGEPVAEQEPMMAPRGSGWSEASLDPREGIAVADVAGATPTYISHQPADLSFSFMPSMPSMPSVQQGMPAWHAPSPFSAHTALAPSNPNAVWIPRTCNSWDHVLVEVQQRKAESQAAGAAAEQAQQHQQQGQQGQQGQQLSFPRGPSPSPQSSAPASPTAAAAAGRGSGGLSLARLPSPPPCPPSPPQQQLAAAAAKPAPDPAHGTANGTAPHGTASEEGSAGNGLLAVAGEARTLAHILEQGAALLQENPQHPLAAQLEAAIGGRAASPALSPSSTEQLLQEVRGLRQLLALQCLQKVAAKKGYRIQGIQRVAHAGDN